MEIASSRYRRGASALFSTREAFIAALSQRKITPCLQTSGQGIALIPLSHLPLFEGMARRQSAGLDRQA
jgi:hypothetical protein